MRGLRSFLGLFVILIALAAYLYFVESKQTPGSDTDEKKEKVFAVETEKIDEVTIKSASGDRTTLKKAGSDWQIVAPLQVASDGTEVSGITSNISTLEIQRVIDENAADLKEYGLAEPRIEVTFTADGKQQTLQIGDKTPPGSDLYAKLADQKKVFLIPSFVESSFNKTTFDLRDKAALKVDRDKVDALEVATADRQLRFAKTDGEWRMTAPATGRTDFTVVESLVGRLASAEMKSIAAAEATDLKQYGLDKPSATVRIGSGSSQATLLIGKAAEEGNVYAKDQSRPAVFTLESSLSDELKKNADEFRQKDLFDARSFNSTRVEVVRSGQAIAFEKSKAKDKDGKEEEKWRQVAPAAKDVDTAQVDALVTAVTGVRADSFVDPGSAKGVKAALDKPELTVTLKFDEGKKEERVAFARSGSDAYASRAGEPNAAKIPASALDSIVKALEEIK
jgi:Domain of unknown function (DUF4340)